jgi:hypothetical protein
LEGSLPALAAALAHPVLDATPQPSTIRRASRKGSVASNFEPLNPVFAPPQLYVPVVYELPGSLLGRIVIGAK